MIKVWDIKTESNTNEWAKRVWEEINKYRKIGPAIVKDILKHISEEGRLLDAISMYILPQLEGLTDDKKTKIIIELNKIVVEKGENGNDLIDVASDFFDMDKGKFNGKDNS